LHSGWLHRGRGRRTLRRRDACRLLASPPSSSELAGGLWPARPLVGFTFIGAVPHTDWLGNCLRLDRHFVLSPDYSPGSGDKHESCMTGGRRRDDDGLGCGARVLERPGSGTRTRQAGLRR
jgi:hypothetical protein